MDAKRVGTDLPPDWRERLAERLAEPLPDPVYLMHPHDYDDLLRSTDA